MNPANNNFNFNNINFETPNSDFVKNYNEREFGRSMAENFFRGVEMEDIFEEFVENNLMKFFPKLSSVENSSNANNKISTQANSKKTNVNTCIHVDRPYYAKGKCRSCYIKKGRVKIPDCEHKDRPMYSKGLCVNCYRVQSKTAKLQNKNKIHNTIEEYSD